jgi:RND family efflux transporter MFP subunit
MLNEMLFRRWVVIPLGLSAMLAGCAGPSADGEGSGETAAAPPAVHLLQVETVTLETTRFADERNLVGETEPVRAAFVSAEMPGRITTLVGERGARVNAGDTLLRVDAASQQAQIDQIEVQIAGIDTEIDRTERLMQRGLGTEATLDQLRNQRAVLEESISGIRTNLRSATVRAPISGIVTERMAEPGEIASPGVPLLRIVDISTIVVSVGLPEREIGNVDVGQQVRVEIPALGEAFTGSIHRIAAEGNRSNRTFTTEIHIANEAETLRAGLRAIVTIPRADIDDAIVVPQDAIIQGLQGPEAIVVNNDITELRQVATGPRRGGFLVVTEGLAAGDQLAVRGHRNVVNGEQVSVTNVGACCSEQLEAAFPTANAAAP